jgi:hypothetical protein
MTATFDDMFDMFNLEDQTIIEIDDFDEESPMTEINLVMRSKNTAMIVRVGWGSLGLHADVYGYRDGLPVPTQNVELGLATTVYVRD